MHFILGMIETIIATSSVVTRQPTLRVAPLNLTTYFRKSRRFPLEQPYRNLWVSWAMRERRYLRLQWHSHQSLAFSLLQDLI